MKQKLLLFIGLFLCFLSASLGQSTSNVGANLVVNPSFEDFSATPIGWFKKGEHYTRVMKYWESPTSASPDIFGPKIRVPNYWAEKGFGKQSPHSGWAMTGLTTYGCESKSTHCREYVSVQLNEPLIIGQIYYAEMYVSHLADSYVANNLGMYFSEEKINLMTDERIEAAPQFEVKDILKIKNNKWKKIGGQFIAKTEAEYLIIGNFNTDEDTAFEIVEDGIIPYAYYYIDDIEVKKLPPYLPVPVKENDLSFIELEEGKTIQLKDIYFDFDSWELHPRSFVELRKLLKILQIHPTMTIEIIGHTDSIGEDRYNKYLSRKRAKSVVVHLIKNTIKVQRLNYKGEGEGIPVATNKTEDGRRLNRRVEFRIVKK
ncbi:MAG: OOP family OmpA-OmpF porin [Saprospiraceae bacterium]|jgi:OOP family OmpA-OmpF porin